METTKTNKIVSIILPTQAGKTFHTIDSISKLIDEDEIEGKSLSLVFTMNTLLNNSQFAKRLDHIEKRYGEGSVLIFASKYNGKLKFVKKKEELFGLCFNMETHPKVVIMCSNYKRFNDMINVVNSIQKNSNFVDRMKLYFDELHKYIDQFKLREKLIELNEMSIVEEIVAMTATPYQLFNTECDFWKNIKLMDLDYYLDENYIGYNDLNIIINEYNDLVNFINIEEKIYDKEDSKILDYIRRILESNPDIISNNTFTFIPAHIRRTGHYGVRDLVHSINKDVIVVILNGEKKCIEYYENEIFKVYNLDVKTDEVCNVINRNINDLNLKNRPIVITGFLCLGMGQTLTCPGLGSFTSAIISHNDLNNDDIYQLCGRITGKMRNWSNYVKTNLYCTERTKKIFENMEKCAKNLVEDFNGEEITKEDYISPINDMEVMGSFEKKIKSSSKKVKNDSKMTVPKYYSLTDEEYEIIEKSNKNSREKIILNYIKEKEFNLYDFLTEKGFKKIQITTPISEVSYKKHITDVINHANNNSKFAIDFNKNDKETNCYNVYIDNREKRLCIVMWYGTSS